MIYGYARVSTAGQARDGNSLADQLKKLKEAGAQKCFADSFTGTKVDRPEFSKVLALLTCGDTLVVTKLDRLARTTAGGIEAVEGLLKKGVAVHVLNMGRIDDTPTGRLILHVMLAFAEFERDMIVQRTQEGKAVAREREGYREGRPKASVDEEAFQKIAQKQKRGELTAEEAARLLGVSKSTYYRRLAA